MTSYEIRYEARRATRSFAHSRSSLAQHTNTDTTHAHAHGCSCACSTQATDVRAICAAGNGPVRQHATRYRHLRLGPRGNEGALLHASSNLCAVHCLCVGAQLVQLDAKKATEKSSLDCSFAQCWSPSILRLLLYSIHSILSSRTLLKTRAAELPSSPHSRNTAPLGQPKNTAAPRRRHVQEEEEKEEEDEEDEEEGEEGGEEKDKE
jgi:hypothetical protein